MDNENKEDPVATENKPDHRQKSILIVEDDPASQNILSRLLKNKGYPIVTANNGNEAMIATEKEKPRLALVDVVMPEVSGMAFLRWLRERHPEIRVIMLSVLEEQTKVAREAKALGVYGYFSKPPNFQDLLTKIDEAMV